MAIAYACAGGVPSQDKTPNTVDETTGVRLSHAAWRRTARLHYSREFVTKLQRHHARWVRGAAKEGSILETVC